MSLIKTNFEMPRGDDPVKQAQRLSQDLTSNFKAILKEINDLKSNTTSSALNPYGLSGIELSGSFSITVPSAAGTRFQIFTLTHDFGSLPSGFLITDLTSSNSSVLTSPIVTRDSWTTTQITIRIAISTLDFATSRTQTGTFKILVLR